MTSSSKFFTAATLILLGATGCGHKAQEVEPLSNQVQAQVNQNLQNSRIPTVDEVEAGQVPVAENECTRFRSTLPKDYIQDLIEVPEDPSQPDGKKIKIFYYGKLAVGATPIFFYNGGPGSDSHGSYRAITSAQSLFDTDHKLSFIFIDQRGNGCSEFYPQGNTPETLQRLVNYGSIGIVGDSELIRKKLVNDKKVIPFGQSYGAFIVHRYATLFPSSVKASFAHANTITSDSYQRAKNRVASQKRVNDFYFSQYPDDVERVKSLRKYLTIDKCFVSTTDSKEKRCGLSVLNPFPSTYLGFTNQWDTLHGWIGKMVPDSGISDDGISKFLAALVFGKSNPLNIKGTAEEVIGYSDRNVQDLDSATCNKIKTDLASSNINLDEVLFNECASALQRKAFPAQPDKFANLKRQLLTLTDFTNALKQAPQTNFYAYSGQKDPYVPVEEFAEELQATKDISNFKYFNFPSSGHEGYKTEPLLWQELIQEATATQN